MRVVAASLGAVIVLAIAAWLAIVPGAWIESDDPPRIHVGDRYVYNVTSPSGRFGADLEVSLLEVVDGSLIVSYASADDIPWIERIELESGRVRYQERECYADDCSRAQRYYTSTGKPGLLGASAFLIESPPRADDVLPVAFTHRGSASTQKFTAADGENECTLVKPVNATRALPLMRWYLAGTPWKDLTAEFCPASPMPVSLTTGGYRFRLDTYTAGNGAEIAFGTHLVDFAPPVLLTERTARKDSLPPEGSTLANATSFHEILAWGRANDSGLRRYLAEHPAYNLRHAYKSLNGWGSFLPTPALNTYGLEVSEWDFDLQDSRSTDGYTFRVQERTDRYAGAHESRVFTVIESAPREWEPSLDLDRLPNKLVPLSTATDFAARTFEGWRRSQIGIASYWTDGDVDSFQAHEDFYAYNFRYSSVRPPASIGILFELYIDATTGEVLMIDGPVDAIAKLAAMGSA